MIIFAAPDAHMTENPGWGKLAFLVGAALLFWAFTAGHKRLLGLRQEGHSPAAIDPSQEGLKPLVSPDETETSETSSTPRGSGFAKADDDLDRFVDEHHGRVPTKQLVALAMGQFRVGRATVFRRMQEAKRRREYSDSPEDDS